MNNLIIFHFFSVVLVVIFSSLLDMSIFLELNKNEDKISTILKALLEIIGVCLLTYFILSNLNNFSIIFTDRMKKYFPLILILITVLVNNVLKTRMNDKLVSLFWHFFGEVKKQTKNIIDSNSDTNNNENNSNNNNLSNNFKKIYYKHKIKNSEDQFNLHWYYPELKNNINDDVNSGKFKYIDINDEQVNPNSIVEIRQEM